MACRLERWRPNVDVTRHGTAHREINELVIPVRSDLLRAGTRPVWDGTRPSLNDRARFATVRNTFLVSL